MTLLHPLLRDENADHSPSFLSAAIWHCGKRPTKEGGREKKRTPETKLLADEIDLFSPSGTDGGERLFGI